VTEAHRCK